MIPLEQLFVSVALVIPVVKETVSRLLRWFNGVFDNTTLFLLLLLKIIYVKMLDTIVCSGPLVWLFSPAAVTLDVGFICPFVVIDSTD